MYPEGETPQVTLQVPLAAVLIHTDHAAPEHAEQTFNRIRRDQFVALAVGILARGMVHRLVRGELGADRIAKPAFIGIQARPARCVDDDVYQVSLTVTHRVTLIMSWFW